MKLQETVISSESLYQGKIINLRRDVVRLENGGEALREVIEHPGGVGILPLDHDGMVYMVRQYRHGARGVELEIPAGKLNYGEDALECGKRELREETGAVAEKYTFLGELYPSPGYVGEIIYMYMAENLAFGDTDPDEDEFVETVKIPFDKALEMVMNGEIKDAKTQAAILKAAVMRNRK